MKNVFLAFTMLILAVCAAALAQTKSAPPATKATDKAAPKAATPAKAAGPNLLNPATMNAKAPPVFLVKLNTTKGPIVIRVTKLWAPNGAERFYNLVRAGFYTDAAFFRVIPGFMAQFGISARPEVSRIWAEKGMFDDPVKQSNKRGMVTYAQSSLPNSRSTQLFINYGNNSRLDADRFAPFGEVIEGMEVADQIYSGYGEQPDQGAITSQGKAYLDRQFPRLDRIINAVIEPLPDDSSKDAPAKGAPSKDDAKKDDGKKTKS
jgi:peptidyl-prolyl cis-trans isomerase A (cyclophilin A)